MSWLFKAPARVVRVDGVYVSNASCVHKFSRKWCGGAAGLATVHDRLLSSETNSTFIAVFEDDHRPLDRLWWEKMNAVLQKVPSPWDVVRFDCTGYVPPTFPWLNSHMFQTHHASACHRTDPTIKRCWFCGGTHALVYNMSARHRIKHYLIRSPFDDIDCRMSRNPWGERNYCYNSKIFGKTPRLGTDIPKI